MKLFSFIINNMSFRLYIPDRKYYKMTDYNLACKSDDLTLRAVKIVFADVK
jgi:hypothetical protein